MTSETTKTDGLTYQSAPAPGRWTELTVGPLYTVKYRAKTRTWDVIDNDGDIIRSLPSRQMAVNYAARIAREDA
jgi:hypothetical protein